MCLNDFHKCTGDSRSTEIEIKRYEKRSLFEERRNKRRADSEPVVRPEWSTKVQILRSLTVRSSIVRQERAGRPPNARNKRKSAEWSPVISPKQRGRPPNPWIFYGESGQLFANIKEQQSNPDKVQVPLGGVIRPDSKNDRPN